jgi:hypothetical protein
MIIRTIEITTRMHKSNVDKVVETIATVGMWVWAHA